MIDYLYKREVGVGYPWNINQKFKYWIAPNVMLGITPSPEGVTVHCNRELTKEEKATLDRIMSEPSPALPPAKKGSIILIRDIDTWMDAIIAETGLKLEYYVRKGADGYDHLEVHVPEESQIQKVYQAFVDLIKIEK